MTISDIRRLSNRPREIRILRRDHEGPLEAAMTTVKPEAPVCLGEVALGGKEVSDPGRVPRRCVDAGTDRRDHGRPILLSTWFGCVWGTRGRNLWLHAGQELPHRGGIRAVNLQALTDESTSATRRIKLASALNSCVRAGWSVRCPDRAPSTTPTCCASSPPRSSSATASQPTRREVGHTMSVGLRSRPSATFPANSVVRSQSKITCPFSTSRSR